MSTMNAASRPRAKGPIVWLDMDQQELDDAYDQRVYAPNQEQIHQRRDFCNAIAREMLGPPQKLRYGAGAMETIDLYRTKTPNAPVNIYIHGGAWKSGTAAKVAYMAETFVRAGAHFAALDFNNVLETDGDLFPMVDQVRRAVAWIYHNAASFGGDPGRLYVTGHSSGGHLAGCVVITDWTEYGLSENPLKGALLGSGMYDLKAPRLSKRSQYVKFTDAMEQALSPQRHVDRIAIPIVITYGTLETPEFQRQTRDFHAALKAAGKDVRLVAGPSYNHFETHETMGNPYGFMGRAALEMMGLAPA